VSTERYLVVNADDFGYGACVNEGIIESYERGIVTSASLMVYRSQAVAAAQYARRNASLGVGIHLDLGEWVYSDGDWVLSYHRVDLADPSAVAHEVREQIAAFRDLVGQNPTHIDSHQHVHLREPVRKVVIRHGRTMDIPVRQFSSRVRYCGDFYGQTREGEPLPEKVSTPALCGLLEALAPGVTELGCHPGSSQGLASVYARERDCEVKTLCDPAVRERLVSLHITLVSFADLRVAGVS
jgi:predicted glycoside hydrolase/deacetylase ChbG (UPF0249 family)